MLLTTCFRLFAALLMSIDKPELVRPAPATCSPVMYLGMPEYSSASAANFSSTPSSSAAFEPGWKKSIGLDESAKSLYAVCQIFHGYMDVMFSSGGRRDTLTIT